MKMQLSTLIFVFGISCTLTVQAQYASVLWYNRPAVNWNEALPLGNGRLGAMVFGGAKTELLSLNESSLWSGGPRNWNNPSASQHLPLVRQAVALQQYHKADSLAKFMQGPYTESYLPLADLQINYDGIDDSAAYRRQLNLDSAVNRLVFTCNNKLYSRTVFASFPDQVIVYHDSCNQKSALSYRVSLTSKLHYKVETIAPNHIVLTGKCPKHVEPAYLWKIKDDEAIQYADDVKGEGMNFEVHVYIKAISGKISCNNNSIRVENADATTLFISAATSYNGFQRSPGMEGKSPSVQAASTLKKAVHKSFGMLLQRHVQDYQPMYRRVQYFLGESKYKALPTDQRLKLMNEYADPELVATIAQYGRYLLIAGSRGGQPVNLKGIWNDKVRPEYSSNWCIDHDAQMFYYAAETNHLSEMHQPFLQLVEDLSVNGTKTARVNYGMNGWCAHHNTDIWRQTAPVGNYGEGNPHWANWNMSGPWLCNHLFEHYLFTGDKKFLREKAWPAMKGAALFCLNWMTKDTAGLLQTVPSVSPENTFITTDGDTAQISRNTTADIALIKELLQHCLQTAALLKIKDQFTEQLETTLQHLPVYKTGSEGQLLEWENEWQPVDPSHRHLSHLYPVFPGSEISVLHTPALAMAAKKALTLRTKTNSSWGFAWKAACWARLHEADSAWVTWQNQLRYVAASGRKVAGSYGLYPNLFNSEAPSTIMNGNGCASAVLTEMLLQSHTGELVLLPALPPVFMEGSVSGLCARGGFVVGIRWLHRQLQTAVIDSKLGNECRLVVSHAVTIFDNHKKVPFSRDANGVLVFSTLKGHRYTIKPN